MPNRRNAHSQSVPRYAELNFEIENEYAQSLIVPEEYWSDQRKKHSLKQIGEMPSWISQLKKRANSNWCVSQQE